MKQKLPDELQDQDKVSRVNAKHHAVTNSVKTLSLEGDGLNMCLSPSLPFTVINQNENGTQDTLEMTLPEDVDQIENLGPQDIELLRPSLKK